MQNRAVRVPHYKKAAAITAQRYVETLVSEYRVIGGLS